MLLPKLDSECGAGSNTGSDIDKTFEIEMLPPTPLK
jgi:hypothetical protein